MAASKGSVALPKRWPQLTPFTMGLRLWDPFVAVFVTTDDNNMARFDRFVCVIFPSFHLLKDLLMTWSMTKRNCPVLSTSETVIHHEMRNDRAFLFRNFQSQTSRNSRGRFRLNGTASKMLLDAFSICQFWQDDTQSVSWYHNYIYIYVYTKYIKILYIMQIKYLHVFDHAQSWTALRAALRWYSSGQLVLMTLMDYVAGVAAVAGVAGVARAVGVSLSLEVITAERVARTSFS